MGDVLWMRSIRVSDIFWLLWSYLFIYMSKLINEEMVFFFFLPSSFLVFVERKKGRVLSHVQESGAYGGPLSDEQLAIGVGSPTPSLT